MNSVLQLLRAHRSIRRYTEDPIPDEAVAAAIEAGQAASTSSAVQAYCILRIRDDARRAALVELTGGQKKVQECAAFFVICGDVRRHRLACARAGHPYDAGLEAFLLAVIDSTLFAQNFVVALESMDFGVCYIGGLRNDLHEVNALLNLPEGVYPLYGLCVGRPDEAPSARPRLPRPAVLFEEAYPDDATMLELVDAYDETYRAYRRERGADPHAWSALMAEKFRAPQRESLADFYVRQGASW